MTEIESPNTEASTGLDRRSAIKKAAVAGAVVWSTPIVLSQSVLAAGGGTAKCRPDISLQCQTYFCGQGNKFFPGFRIITSPCKCGEIVTNPTVCAILGTGTVTSTCGAVTLYGNGTDCNPPGSSNSGSDVILTPGTWQCVPSTPIYYFGQPRSGGGNGAISEIGNGCQIGFQLGVWAGNCPTGSPPLAFRCETFQVTMTWNNGSNTVSCTISDVLNDPLCAGVGASSPCGRC